MFPGGKPFSCVFSENAKNSIFVKKWNFYENRGNRDFQGIEVSAKIKKKIFAKKFWPGPKFPFFILGGLKTLANSRLRGTVRTAENPKK